MISTIGGEREIGLPQDTFYRPEGSVIPMITPARLDEHGKVVVDGESLTHLVDHLIEGGSNALFILGSAGEFRTQTLDQKKEVIEKTVKAVDGRVPILVGISARSIEETKDLVEFTKDYPVAALIITPLYGEGEPHEKLAIALSSDKPVLLYNNPGIHGNEALPLDFVRMSRAHPRVIGIKSTSDDEAYIEKLRLLQTDKFRVLLGSTAQIPLAREKQLSGVVIASGNIFPREVLEVFHDGNTGIFNRLMEERTRYGSMTEIKRGLVDRGIITSDVLFENSQTG